MSPGVRNAAGLAIGLIGTAVALALFGSGLDGTAPPSPVVVPVGALGMLAGGAALGGVLVAGRAVSPWAPLSSGLLCAAGSVATLADPAALAGAGPAAVVFGRQFGLGLTALMLLGAVALRPAQRAPARQEPTPTAHRPTDPGLRPLPVAATYRSGPVRPQGPGPRHRAAPRRQQPVAYPRRPDPRMRRPI